MTSPTTFLKIGSFLPSAILVSVAMMFAGLYEWVNAAWTLDDAPTVMITEKASTKDKPKWIRRRRPVLHALGILIATHFLGLLVFCAITTSLFAKYWSVSLQYLVCMTKVSYTPTGAFPAASICRLCAPIGHCPHHLHLSTSAAQCSAFIPREILEPLSSLHRDIHNIRSQLFSCSGPRNPPWTTSNSRIPDPHILIKCRYTVRQIHCIYCTWIWVDSLGTGRDYKSYLELGNSRGMVRSIYMHSVRATGATSRARMSLAVTVNNLYKILFLHTNNIHKPYSVATRRRLTDR